MEYSQQIYRHSYLTTSIKLQVRSKKNTKGALCIFSSCNMMTNNIKFLPRTCKEKEKGIKSQNCPLVQRGWGGCFVIEKNPMGSNHISIVNLIKQLHVDKSNHTNKRFTVNLHNNNMEAKFITLYTAYHNFNPNSYCKSFYIFYTIFASQGFTMPSSPF